MADVMAIEDLQKLDVLTTRQICALLQCDPRLIADECNRWTASRGRDGLRFFMLGNARRFRKEAVVAWMDKMEKRVWA